ncbi:alpha-amylase [bacterium]|nr:alpha-amylase [candidate division CSSED10-310 bacterium]
MGSGTQIPSVPIMEFHVARTAREKYRFDESLFSLSGNILIADFAAARRFAQAMNDRLDLLQLPEQAVPAGHINAMGLMDEISHLLVRKYRETTHPKAMRDALDYLEKTVGTQDLDHALAVFTEDFPPLAVYRGELTPADYLESESGGVPHREILLEELLLLWLSSVNPAYFRYWELFDTGRLKHQTRFIEIMEEIGKFFRSHPGWGPSGRDLISLLLEPSRKHPDSIEKQLQYMLSFWQPLIGEVFFRLLAGLDLISEETKPGLTGPGPAVVFDYKGMDAEPERFSPDLDWMPRLVLIAKNIHVWLHQLSKQTGRNIRYLNEIPDGELERLADSGFTGLWLIGIWQRSPASQRIKQLCGNPEALASAYSLYDYRIADDLGGEPALSDLKNRAGQYGIRLASDMVPNHMGIDSPWVMDHPDWFIIVRRNPFPSYSFTGPDLSECPEVTIQVEDHYFSRSDAAVVFKRTDNRTGDVQYIYHGNDGTGMPWNDTAQLNYLKPDVREAVIRKILDVSRLFPIIRFDAAMTLTKRHFHRLWFPEPGTGGAIPSRTEHSLSRDDFNRFMPEEFWREVVDRVARELPDTLLLAEAFWLMEGFFVRTLGMHRVYNSAFMNMLRDEDNAKYRAVLKNTLEFDPRIMRRFVNFMNNPDEKTAVEQFGKGDKYFGICVMMCTLPGLPMFGHGQIEGFEEKYGMEYRRAYRDEKPDEGFSEHHRRIIFPLLHRRHLFSEVENFLLYDFENPNGTVNEDVLAFSNHRDGERVLILYHNRSGETHGRVRTTPLNQVSLAQGLNLGSGSNRFCTFRDHISGLHYVISCDRLTDAGFECSLSAYECRVLVDFQEVPGDDVNRYADIARYLSGRGVPDLEEIRIELLYQPVYHPLQAMLSPDVIRECIRRFSEMRDYPDPDEPAHPDTGPLAGRFGSLQDALRDAMAELLPDFPTWTTTPDLHRLRLQAIQELLLGCHAKEKSAVKKIRKSLRRRFVNDPGNWCILLGWHLFRETGGNRETSVRHFDQLRLHKKIRDAAVQAGLSPEPATRTADMVRILLACGEIDPGLAASGSGLAALTGALLSNPALQAYLGVHRFQDEWYFNKETFEELIRWLQIIGILQVRSSLNAAGQNRSSADILDGLDRVLKEAETAGYRTEILIARLKST